MNGRIQREKASKRKTSVIQYRKRGWELRCRENRNEKKRDSRKRI